VAKIHEAQSIQQAVLTFCYFGIKQKVKMILICQTIFFCYFFHQWKKIDNPWGKPKEVRTKMLVLFQNSIFKKITAGYQYVGINKIIFPYVFVGQY